MQEYIELSSMHYRQMESPLETIFGYYLWVSKHSIVYKRNRCSDQPCPCMNDEGSLNIWDMVFDRVYKLFRITAEAWIKRFKSICLFETSSFSQTQFTLMKFIHLHPKRPQFPFLCNNDIIYIVSRWHWYTSKSAQVAQ